MNPGSVTRMAAPVTPMSNFVSVQRRATNGPGRLVRRVLDHVPSRYVARDVNEKLEKPRQLVRQQAAASTAPDEAISVAQAAAMLLLEVAWADHEIEAAELDAMRRTLRSLYLMEVPHSRRLR